MAMFSAARSVAGHHRPESYARSGGPRRSRPTVTTYEQQNHYGPLTSSGSHMPLDTNIHWEWRNPLNLIPAVLLMLALIAVVALAV